MSNSALTSLLLVLLLLIGSAQLLGALFVRLRQPKVIGEILAAVTPPTEPTKWSHRRDAPGSQQIRRERKDLCACFDIPLQSVTAQEHRDEESEHGQENDRG